LKLKELKKPEEKIIKMQEKKKKERKIVKKNEIVTNQFITHN